jgi:hypothetical protein
MAVRLKKMPNACSNDVWHIVEGGALIATVLPWPTSRGKRYVLVDDNNNAVDLYPSPQAARLAAKAYLKR